MGTVIVWRGKAYIFRGKSTGEALDAFIRKWLPEDTDWMNDRYQIFPIIGISHQPNTTEGA